MYLGIDIGTSEVKALLLSDQHQVIATAGSRLEVSRPHPGHSEQDPASWWGATCKALKALQLQHPAEYAAYVASALRQASHTLAGVAGISM